MSKTIAETQHYLLMHLDSDCPDQSFTQQELQDECDKIRDAPPQDADRQKVIDGMLGMDFLIKEEKEQKLYYKLNPAKRLDIEGIRKMYVARQAAALTTPPENNSI